MELKSIEKDKTIEVINRIEIDDVPLNKKAYQLLMMRIDTCNDQFEPMSIRDFFKELLFTMWCLKENFDGKNVDKYGENWEHRIHIPMIKHKLVDGIIDDFGMPHVNEIEADTLVLRAIELI